MGEPVDGERRLRLERNVRLALALRVCIFISAISVPTITKLSQQNGLTQSEWLLIQLLFNVVLLTVDLPTGYFADRVSRKLSLLLGGALLVAGSSLYGLSTNFNTMLLAEVVLGIGYGFCSGADHALLYESLVELERESDYDRYVRMLSSIELLAISLFALAGGFIGSINVRYPFFVEASVFLLFIVLAGRFIETNRILTGKKRSFLSALASANILREESRRLDLQLAMSALTFGIFQTLIWFYQPIFDLNSIPLYVNGFFFMGVSFLAAIVAHFSGWAERQFGGYPKVLYIPLGFGVTVLCGISFLPHPAALALLVLVPLGRGLNNTLLLGELNRVIHSEVRATMLSLRTAANRTFYMAVLLLCSILSLRLSTLQTLGVCGVITGLSGFALYWRLRVVGRS